MSIMAWPNSQWNQSMVVTDAARDTNFDVVPRNVPLLGLVIRNVSPSESLNLQKGHHLNW
jgi:hypothetical protein